jgi:hypothetical protein
VAEVEAIASRRARASLAAGGNVAADGRPRDSLVFTAQQGGPVTDGHFRNRAWYPAIRVAGIRRFRAPDHAPHGR